MEIKLEHKKLIDSLCSSLHLPISDYCFSNIFLFRKFHDFKLHLLSDAQYALTGLSCKRKPFFMPLYHPTDWDVCKSLARQYKSIYIYPVSEEWWSEIHREEIEICEDDSDYLVETEKIRTYRGRHYDGHRYNVRKFLEAFHVEVRPFQKDLFDEATSLVKEWEANHRNLQVESDVEPCFEALEHFDYLGLTGYLFYVDQKLRGLLMGQALLPDVVVLHFAKAVSVSAGLCQYMYQYFAQQLSSQYLYLNWEQDLGIEGLRQAKRSFHPCRMVLKGHVRCSPDD